VKGLVLIGGGGHCKAAIDVIEELGFTITGVLDRSESGLNKVLGHPVLGGDDILPVLVTQGYAALVTIGQIKSALPRIRAFDAAQAAGAQMPCVISPRAHVSRYATMGIGTLVLHGAVVNAAARVGNNVIVNSLALIEHDAEVGDHCHVATGARVNGNVTIGAGCFIGSGAVLKNGIAIGAGSVIGAGAVIRHDIPEGSLVHVTQQRNPI
jgi:sugar O-acyltransferase (sialic acid O-acetyltransferase NeuD family)